MAWNAALAVVVRTAAGARTSGPAYRTDAVSPNAGASNAAMTAVGANVVSALRSGSVRLLVNAVSPAVKVRYAEKMDAGGRVGAAPQTAPAGITDNPVSARRRVSTESSPTPTAPIKHARILVISAFGRML